MYSNVKLEVVGNVNFLRVYITSQVVKSLTSYNSLGMTERVKYYYGRRPITYVFK